jgi:hypothetical protein
VTVITIEGKRLVGVEKGEISCPLAGLAAAVALGAVFSQSRWRTS